MTDIALPPFHVTKTVKHTVEADHRLQQDLERYQAFYRDAYGVKVNEADLIREMARRFMEGDREFQAYRERGQGSRKSRTRTRTRNGPRNGQAGAQDSMGHDASPGDSQAKPAVHAAAN